MTIEEAIERGDVVQIQDLLENGACLPSSLNGGYSPLTWATQTNNGTLAMLLIKAGEDIYKPDQNGILPQYTLAMNVYEVPARHNKINRILYCPFSRSSIEPFFSTTPSIV